jgi:hypothetical protein
MKGHLVLGFLRTSSSARSANCAPVITAAELFRLAIGGDHDAVPMPPAAHPDWPARELRVQRDFATGEEAIAIDVQDADGRGSFHMVSGYFRSPTVPAESTEISRAAVGTFVVTVFPPGQRTQICVGDSEMAIICTALS